jgi:hypothetical protein
MKIGASGKEMAIGLISSLLENRFPDLTTLIALAPNA